MRLRPGNAVHARQEDTLPPCTTLDQGGGVRCARQVANVQHGAGCNAPSCLVSVRGFCVLHRSRNIPLVLGPAMVGASEGVSPLGMRARVEAYAQRVPLV